MCSICICVHMYTCIHISNIEYEIYIWNIIANIYMYVCLFQIISAGSELFSYPLVRIAFKLSIEIWESPTRMFDKGYCSGHRKHRID